MALIIFKKFTFGFMADLYTKAVTPTIADIQITTAMAITRTLASPKNDQKFR